MEEGIDEIWLMEYNSNGIERYRIDMITFL